MQYFFVPVVIMESWNALIGGVTVIRSRFYNVNLKQHGGLIRKWTDAKGSKTTTYWPKKIINENLSNREEVTNFTGVLNFGEELYAWNENVEFHKSSRGIA